MYKRLILLRKALNITQAALAKKIGVTRFAISNYESGMRNITDRTVRQICAAYNVSYDWLTTGQGEMFVSAGDSPGKAVDSIMQGDNDFAKLVFKCLVQFSDDDWERLHALCDAVLAAVEKAKNSGQ